MTWEQHPRLRQQSEDRINTLAKFQYENSFSKEEMADHFRLLAQAKIEGFATIEEYQEYLKEQENQKLIPTEFTHWDQIAKQIKGDKYPMTIKLGGGNLD